MYFVTMEGVYIQGIYGIFETEQEARDYAVDLIRKEHDDYHSFCVNKFNEGYSYNTIDTYIRKDTLVEGINKEVKRISKNWIYHGDKFNMKIKCEKSNIIIEEERIK